MNSRLADVHYTPLEIALEMADQLNINNNVTIFDPCCGEGALLKAIRRKYPWHKLRFIGFDIDNDALYKCMKDSEIGLNAMDSVYQNHDIFDWEGNYNADYIIMNPPFPSPTCELAICKAFEFFDKGIMYIPFDKLRITDFSIFTEIQLEAYSKDYLEVVFDCEIKHPQGYLYWRKK